MTELQISGMTTVALAVMLVSIVLNDIRTHRITNVSVLMVLGLGLASQVASNEAMGIAHWLSGMAVGFAIFIPFYIGGGMGAGDVKLMAAVGSVLGTGGAAAAGAVALVAGLPLALVVVLHRVISEKRAMQFMANAQHGAQQIRGWSINSFTREGSKQRIPFAAAIAVGAIGSLWWTGKLQQLAGVL